MSKDIWLTAYDDAVEQLMEELGIEDEDELIEEDVMVLADSLYEDRIAGMMERYKTRKEEE